MYFLLGYQKARSGKLNSWFAVFAVLLLLLWYVLKATEIKLTAIAPDDQWNFDWGVARRMSDPSHWLLVFVAFMLLASYIAARIMNLELPRSVRKVSALSVAFVGLIYLVLVRIGHGTFFYCAKYDTAVMWIQVAEGFTNLTIIAAGVLAGIFWIAVFLKTLATAQREESLTTAFLVPGILATMIAVFFSAMINVRSAVFRAVPYFPGRPEERDYPNSAVVIFQMVGLLGVILIAVAIAWVLSRGEEKPENNPVED